MLPNGALCFDVGANIGEKSYSMLAAGARVVAFEPIPVCAAEVAARCQVFRDRLTICEQALGDKPGRAVLNIDTTLTNMSSMRANWHEGFEESLDVEVTTLDSAVEKFGCPDYCKIDVEGWEEHVFQGLTTTLPLISFEYHNDEHAGIDSAMRCLDRLRDLSSNSLEINVTPAEKLEFAYPAWLSPDEFVKVFSTETVSQIGFTYGDIWVRRIPG
jgi:FkbM family methyltransferase